MFSLLECDPTHDFARNDRLRQKITLLRAKAYVCPIEKLPTLEALVVAAPCTGS